MDDFRPMMEHSDVDHAFQSQLLTDLSTGIEAPAPPPISSAGFAADTVQPAMTSTNDHSSDASQSIFAATAAAIAAVDGTALVGNPIAAVTTNNGDHSNQYAMPTNEMDTYQLAANIATQPIQAQQEQQQVHYGGSVVDTENAATANENVIENVAATNPESTTTEPSAAPEDDQSQSKTDDQEDKPTEENATAVAAATDAETPAKTNEDNNNDGDGGNNDDEQNDDSTSQLRELRREEEIDPNQCRVCMTNANLLDIFRIGDRTSFRICDLIMKLVPGVKISERDYLPHQICGVCVDRIEAAYELRQQCEKTDELLRSKLKRSKKTTRRAPAEFLLVDAIAESSESDDDQKSDDEEFKLSEASEESSDSESSDSSYDDKKKRPTNQRGGGAALKRGGGAPLKRAGVTVVAQPLKKPRTAGVVYIKAVKSDDDDAATARPMQRKPGPKSAFKGPLKPGPNNRLAFRCDVCNRPCSSAEALAQHRRIHSDEKCGICSMMFKNKAALQQHIVQRHKDDPNRVCKKCNRVFISPAECQRHIKTAHAETVACNRCRRYFPNRQQLDQHKCMADRKTMDIKPRRSDLETSGSGQDLFKSVAPLTTTYWSDSFSD